VKPDADNGLDRTTALQVEQVRAISTARLVERLGRLGTEGRHAVDQILGSALHLD
jgi:mRNA-degrading endonuclease toxin of MazEF toxin-antitoxin module